MYQNDLNPQKRSWFYHCKHWEWWRSHDIARITSTVNFGVIGIYTFNLELDRQNCHPLLENTLLSTKTGSKFRTEPKDIVFSTSLTWNSWNFENQTFCEYNVSMYWMIIWRYFSLLESESFWSIALIIK